MIKKIKLSCDSYSVVHVLTYITSMYFVTAILLFRWLGYTYTGSLSCSLKLTNMLTSQQCLLLCAWTLYIVFVVIVLGRLSIWWLFPKTSWCCLNKIIALRLFFSKVFSNDNIPSEYSRSRNVNAPYIPAIYMGSEKLLTFMSAKIFGAKLR